MKTQKFLFIIILILTLVLAVGNVLVYSSEKKDEGYLGIAISNLDESEIKISGITYGVIVTGVMEDSPAEKGDLQQYDVIQEFNNQKIEDTEDLYDIVRETEPETKVTITFLRESKKKSTEVILGKRKIYKNFFHSSHPLNKFFFMRMGNYLGIHIQELNPDLGDYFGVKEGEGVLVLSVMDDSPAENAGMKAGDIIIQIGEEKIEDPEDVLDTISDYDEGEKIDITIMRHKNKMTLQVELEEDYKEDIDIFKWHGQMPGKHLRIFGNRWRPRSFDFDIEMDSDPEIEKNIKRNIIRLKDKQILLKDRLRNRIKRVQKKIISI